MQFNATTSMIQSTTHEVFPTGTCDKITLIVWVRPLDAGEGGQGRIFVVDEATNALGLFIASTPAMQLSRIFSGGTANFGVTNAGNWTYNQWTCVAFTYNSSSATNDPTCYLSRFAVADTGFFGMQSRTLSTDSNSTGTAVNPNTGFVIGNRSAGDRTFNGDICFLQLFDRILSHSEIQLCAFKPNKVKAGRLLYAPLIENPAVYGLNGGRILSATPTAIIRGGRPPNVVEYKHQPVFYGAREAPPPPTGTPWYYYAHN